MSKCIVFGGTGFIGSYLVDSLLLYGHEVTLFVRSPDDIIKKDSVKYHFGDFLNSDDIERSLQGQDYVFHLISLTNPAISDLNPFIDIETNVKMTIHLLEGCVKNKIKRVIFTSSGGAIYGNSINELLSEDDVANPISPYAIGKQTIEGFLRYYYHKYDLDNLVLRISNVYGIGQNTTNSKHGVISVFMGKILAGETLQIYGDGSMTRDYIYVKDLADFMANNFEKISKYNTYNIGSGDGYTVNDILSTIENVTGIKAKREYIDSPSSYVKNIVLNCSRACDDFGLVCKTSLINGITEMYNSNIYK